MVDQRLEETRLLGDRQLEHDLLAVRELVQLLKNGGEQQIVRLSPVSALDVHLGLDDRHHRVRQDLLGNLELLGDQHRDAGRVGRVDHRPFLRAENAEPPGTLQEVIETRHRLHHLDAVLFVLKAFVDLDEGHDTLVDQRLRRRLPVDRAVHGPLEQDRADDLAASETRGGDDPRAHFVDKVEHLLIARPGAFLDSIALERLGRGPARLVESSNEAVALANFSGHFRLIHTHPCCCNAATPGSVRPSIHSKNAPPAVETKLKSCATPAWLSAATVSPPPATDTRDPSLVRAAAVFASATVAVSNGGVSNAPSGPFQTNVRQVLSTSARASTAAGPMSRIISSGWTSWTLQVRKLGGFDANSLATTTS